MEIFKTSKINIENLLSSQTLSSALKLGRDQYSKKTYLPGLNNYLLDEKAVAEMKALFGENYNDIVGGQVCLNPNIRKIMQTEIVRLWKDLTKEERIYFDLILSILKETIDSNTSDDWFSNRIFEDLNRVRDRILGDYHEDVNLDIDYSNVGGATLQYVEVSDSDDE